MVIASGDGTFASVIHQIKTACSSNFHKFVFIPMPIGSGNDLAKTLNYKNRVTMLNLNSFLALLNSTKFLLKEVDLW